MEKEEKVETNIEEAKESNEEKKEKKSLRDWWDEHPTEVFVIRCILWILFAAVLPFIFIAWRYGIFTDTSKISLTGWGFIAIIIVVIFVATFIKYIYKGLKPGFAKQCVAGFVGIIIPLLLLYLLVSSIESTIVLFKQALGFVIICELVGIPLNPFPAWLEKKRIQENKDKVDTISSMFWDKFFDKEDKKGDKKK